MNSTNRKMDMRYKHKQAVSNRGPASVHKHIKNIINLELIKEIKTIITRCEFCWFCFAHIITDVKKRLLGTSLVVQWIRIQLQMPETCV